MGMYGGLRRATPAELDRLRADSRLLQAFLFGEPPIVVEERLPGLMGFLLRLTPIKVQRVEEAPPSQNPLWPEPRDDEAMDLEKAWHPLHFLFTGTAWEGSEPACFLINGGEELGDDDDVNVRALDPDQVRSFAAFLSTLTPEEVGRRFDPARMAKLRVYSSGQWEGEEAERERQYLVDIFAELREFVGTAAEAGDAIVVRIS